MAKEIKIYVIIVTRYSTARVVYVGILIIIVKYIKHKIKRKKIYTMN
jgi:hypothetical protein